MSPEIIAAIVSAAAAVVTVVVAVVQTAAAKTSAASALESVSAAQQQVLEAQRSADVAERQVGEARRAAVAAEQQVAVGREQLAQSRIEWAEQRTQTIRGVVRLLVNSAETWHETAALLAGYVMQAGEVGRNDADRNGLLERHLNAIQSLTSAIAAGLPYAVEVPSVRASSICRSGWGAVPP